MEAGYGQFVANIPFYGFAVLCIDHPAVQQMIPALSDHRVITYGFSPQADMRAERIISGRGWRDVRGAVLGRGDADGRGAWGRSSCRCWATIMCQNALAAIAVATEMEIDEAAHQSGACRVSQA